MRVESPHPQSRHRAVGRQEIPFVWKPLAASAEPGQWKSGIPRICFSKRKSGNASECCPISFVLQRQRRDSWRRCGVSRNRATSTIRCRLSSKNACSCTCRGSVRRVTALCGTWDFSSAKAGRPGMQTHCRIRSSKSSRLLKQPVPNAEKLEEQLFGWRASRHPVAIPEPETQLEGDLFDALTVVFVAPRRAARARTASRRRLVK